LKGCAAGDVLVVWKLDRLARSLHDLVVIAADLKGRGVGLKILRRRGGCRYDTPARPDGPCRNRRAKSADLESTFYQMGCATASAATY
jgi:Resolvase, N terminal domain